MGKFNMKSISGYSDKKEETKHVVERYRLGEELLDESSREIVKLRIVNIERKEIVKNPDNKYSIEGIDALAESIRVSGLDQPLIVKKISEQEYMLLGGERRLTAIDKLIADENVKDWNEFTLIPCIIKDPDKIKLPLSAKNKEKYAIISTNKEARKYTDADRYQEMQDWKEIIAELRENGVEEITGEDETGEEMKITIKGQTTRDILTQTMGMSRGQINKFDKVEKKASPDLLNAMLDNNISVGVAEKAVDNLDAEEQAELASAAKERKINPADVSSFKKKDNMTAITSRQLKKDMEKINNAVKDGSAYLTEDEQKEYYKLIRKLETLIVKGEG